MASEGSDRRSGLELPDGVDLVTGVTGTLNLDGVAVPWSIVDGQFSWMRGASMETIEDLLTIVDHQHEILKTLRDDGRFSNPRFELDVQRIVCGAPEQILEEIRGEIQDSQGAVADNVRAVMDNQLDASSTQNTATGNENIQNAASARADQGNDNRSEANPSQNVTVHVRDDEALRREREARDEAATARAETAAEREARVRVEAELTGIRTTLADTTRRLDEARENREELQRNLSAATTRAAVAETRVTALETRVTTSDAERARIESELNDARTELAAAQTELATVRSDLNDAQTNLRRIEDELSDANTRIGNLQTTSDDQAAEITRISGELRTAQADLATIQGELGTVRTELAAAITRAEAAEANVRALEEPLAEAQRDRDIAVANAAQAEADKKAAAERRTDDYDRVLYNRTRTDLENEAIASMQREHLEARNAHALAQENAFKDLETAGRERTKANATAPHEQNAAVMEAQANLATSQSKLEKLQRERATANSVQLQVLNAEILKAEKDLRAAQTELIKAQHDEEVAREDRAAKRVEARLDSVAKVAAAHEKNQNRIERANAIATNRGLPEKPSTREMQNVIVTRLNEARDNDALKFRNEAELKHWLDGEFQADYRQDTDDDGNLISDTGAVTSDERQEALTAALEQFKRENRDERLIYVAAPETSEVRGVPRLHGKARFEGEVVRWVIIGGDIQADGTINGARVAIQVEGRDSEMHFVDENDAIWDRYMEGPHSLRLAINSVAGQKGYQNINPMRTPGGIRYIQVQTDPAAIAAPVPATMTNRPGQIQAMRAQRLAHRREMESDMRAHLAEMVINRQANGGDLSKEALREHLFMEYGQDQQFQAAVNGMSEGERRALFNRLYNGMRHDQPERGFFGRIFKGRRDGRRERMRRYAQDHPGFFGTLGRWRGRWEGFQDHGRYEEIKEFMMRERAQGRSQREILRAARGAYAGPRDARLIQEAMDAVYKEAFENDSPNFEIIDGGRAQQVGSISELLANVTPETQEERNALKRRVLGLTVVTGGAAAAYATGRAGGRFGARSFNYVADSGRGIWKGIKSIGWPTNLPKYTGKVWDWSFKNKAVSWMKPTDELSKKNGFFKNLWIGTKSVPYVVTGTALGLVAAPTAGVSVSFVKDFLGINKEAAEFALNELREKYRTVDTLWNLMNDYGASPQVLNMIQDIATRKGSIEEAVRIAREELEAKGLPSKQILRYYNIGKMDDRIADHNFTGLLAIAFELGYLGENMVRSIPHYIRTNYTEQKKRHTFLANDKKGDTEIKEADYSKKDEAVPFSVGSLYSLLNENMFNISSFISSVKGTAWGEAYEVAQKRHPNASTGEQIFYTIVRYLPDRDFADVVTSLLEVFKMNNTKGEVVRQLLIKGRQSMVDKNVASAISRMTRERVLNARDAQNMPSSEGGNVTVDEPAANNEAATAAPDDQQAAA